MEPIFAEWKEAKPAKYTDSAPYISGFRRNLQRMALKDLAFFVQESFSGPEDIRTLARMHLSTLDSQVTALLNQKDLKLDDYTRAHLLDSQKRIQQVLNAQFDDPIGGMIVHERTPDGNRLHAGGGRLPCGSVALEPAPGRARRVGMGPHSGRAAVSGLPVVLGWLAARSGRRPVYRLGTARRPSAGASAALAGGRVVGRPRARRICLALGRAGQPHRSRLWPGQDGLGALFSRHRGLLRSGPLRDAGRSLVSGRLRAS